MEKVFSTIFRSVLGFVGKGLAPMLLAWVIKATENAEKVTLDNNETFDSNGNPLGLKEQKQLLKTKKREAAVAEIKGHIPDLVEKAIPDKVINFFIEAVLLAKEFDLLPAIQKALST